MKLISTITIFLCCFATVHGYEVIQLDVPEKARESHWSAALAQHLGGKTEVRVKYGRADIVTENHVIEVDRVSSFHEGIGQVVHYRSQLKDKMGILALISNEKKLDRERLAFIEGLCKSLKIELVVIQRAEVL